MKFTFSIRAALHKSWDLYVKHILFFIGLAFIMVLFSIFSNYHHSHSTPDVLLTIIVVIATILWTYVWIHAALAAVDGKEELLNFRSIAAHMPTARQFFGLVVVGVLVGIIVGVGFILLIIPGVYFLTRLAFANTAYVDRQQGIRKSLRYSWKLVTGKVFWTAFLVLIMEVGLMILGALPAMLGMLITYPIGILLMTRLYRDLSTYHAQLDSAVE
ncbi:MAG: hypothetical protein ABIO57_02835 [Candidatus Paceibacterota bacterium]